MAKHSPEPWHVGGVGGCRPKLVYDASGRTIIRSWGSGSDEENEANVQLAAQAPKLREQVRILREALERVSKECPDTPKLEDDPDLTYAYDVLIAETVLMVRTALEATKEGA